MAGCDDDATGTPDFTYHGDLATSPLDLVRFMLGDTTSPSVFSNTEISAALTIAPGPNYAAAILAEAQATRVLGQPRIKIGSTEIDPSKNADGWLAMATRLRAGGPGLVPTDDAPLFDLGDQVQECPPRQFALGLTDAPGAGFGPNGWIDPRRGG